MLLLACNLDMQNGSGSSPQQITAQLWGFLFLLAESLRTCSVCVSVCVYVLCDVLKERDKDDIFSSFGF